MRTVPKLISYVLGLLLHMCWEEGLGQTSLKSRSLLLQAGISPLRCKDYFHSPFTYRGTNWQAGVVYQQESRNMLHIEASYGRGSIQSSVSVPATAQLVNLLGGYFFQLGNKTSNTPKFRFYAGGLGRGFGLLANYAPNLESSQTQTTLSTSINLAGSVKYQFDDWHRVTCTLYTPLAAAIYRPDYPFFGREQWGWTGLGKSRIVSILLAYHYKLAANWQLTASYHYDYFQYNQPQPVFLLSHDLSVGLKKSF
jgi:hypothetical protein